MFGICQSPSSSWVGYRELQRTVQGSDYLKANRAAFDQCIRVMEQCNVIEHRSYRSDGKTVQATSKSKQVFRQYADVLRLPDIDIRNSKRRRNRVIIFLNALMPTPVNKSHLPWNMLKENFPFLRYPTRKKIECKAVEHAIGMPLVDLLSQRPLEIESIAFQSDLTYEKDEIKRLSDTLERINNNDMIDSAVHRAIQVKEKIYTTIEDKLLCSYIQRMELLLLAYKHWEECDLISSFKTFDTMKGAFWNHEDYYLFRWYQPLFGTKGFSTFVNKHGIEHFRRSQNQNEEVLSEFRHDVRRLLYTTVYGEKYQDTRRKYSLFINEMQDIVLPFVALVKDRYKA